MPAQIKCRGRVDEGIHAGEGELLHVQSPPATVRISPVMAAASGDRRKATVAAVTMEEPLLILINIIMHILVMVLVHLPQITQVV